MLRDIVVYDHRVLRHIVMCHRRGTKLSPNLRRVCIIPILRSINFCISRDLVAYDTRIMNLGASRDGSREGEGRGVGVEKGKTLTTCMTPSNMSRHRE